MIRNQKITTYTASGNWALTLAEAKRHLNILDNSFDDLISDYIGSAHVMLYDECALLISGATKGYMTEWVDFRIDVAPVDTVAIYYYDAANTRTLLDSSKYIVNDGLYTYIEFLDNLPSLNTRTWPVEVEVTTTSTNDAMVKQALRMVVGDMFEMRQGEVIGNVKQLSRGTQYQLSLISQRTEI